MNKVVAVILCFTSLCCSGQEAVTLPDFLAQLVEEYEDEFEIVFAEEYDSLCRQFDLDPCAREVRSPYLGLLILHKLFTAKTSGNCSRGDILNVPYMWHWTEPNPRHAIYALPDSIPLTEISPPEGFSRYASLADVDRTPHLFLGDMFSQRPRYWSEECGEFYSFGWCSEREMAFGAGIRALGYYVGRVIVSGAHSWTEVRLQIGERYFIVRVDNTYDEYEWHEVDEREASIWINAENETDQGKWYQRVATSNVERERLGEIHVSNNTMNRIKSSLKTYVTD